MAGDSYCYIVWNIRENKIATTTALRRSAEEWVKRQQYPQDYKVQRWRHHSREGVDL